MLCKNDNQDARLKLPPGKKFGEIYDFQTRREYNKSIKTSDGQTVCHKYHLKGVCNEKYLFKDSRIILKDLDILKLTDFKKFALSKSKTNADQNSQKVSSIDIFRDKPRPDSL